MKAPVANRPAMGYKRSVRIPFITTCRVPASLEEVTSRRAAAEVHPREVGVKATAVEDIWHAVERVYQTGIHPAIQLCVRRHGAVLIDRAIGHACGNGPHDPPDAKKVRATPDTPFTIFSAAKAVTAMVVHLLDQRNLIRLDDRVCEYIPEFGVHEKQWITIRHVLTHRAGIPNLPPRAMRLEQLKDPEGIVHILCKEEPTSRAGRQLAYHAISGGFILGEVVRRVTGKDIRTFLDEEILRPLKFRWMNYGVRRRDVRKVAINYFTGPPPLPPLSILLERAFGVSVREAVERSNDPRFLTSVVPSANIVATADELSRFYQLLLNGGELDGTRIFDPRTIQRATAEQTYFEFDFTLGVPLRYAMGFILGAQWLSMYGPDTERVFGHLGFTNILSWADPERQVAAAIMTSGKPLLYPQLYYAYDVVRQISGACTKVRQLKARRLVSPAAGPAPRPARLRRVGRRAGPAPQQHQRRRHHAPSEDITEAGVEGLEVQSAHVPGDDFGAE
jgi:CubicO group peptidase (beta-lactamase class C family)